MKDTQVQSLGQEDPLEKEMATHSSILTWRIPWKEEPSGPQSTGSQSRTRLIERLNLRGVREGYIPGLYPLLGHVYLFLVSLFIIFLLSIHECMLSHFSSVRLCDPMNCSPPGSSLHGILQAGILEWVVIPFSRGSCDSSNRTRIFYISHIGKQVLYH